jgi:hypothetical protein
MRTRRLLEIKDKRKGKLKLALRLCASSAGKARRQGTQARHASEARKRGTQARQTDAREALQALAELLVIETAGAIGVKAFPEVVDALEQVFAVFKRAQLLCEGLL